MSEKLKPLPTNRIDSLDYLRGLAALGIMLYHMHLFTFGESDSATVLARVKIYDVSIFYILSGLTLCVVHFNNFSFNKTALREFYVKRFFRIVPLLWLATALTFLVAFQPNYLLPKKLIANILVIPGAFKPETFVANGAWSIGDELFFYLTFPFIMFLGKYNKTLLFIFIALTFGMMAWYSFRVLNGEVALGMQWAAYVNPIGQIFFFAAGIGLGFIEKGMHKFGRWSLIAIVAIFALIALYPASGEPIHLVTGLTHLILTALITILCFLVYKSDFDVLPVFIQKTLAFLGEISFSLYLIHPIIYHLLKTIFDRFLPVSPYVLIGSTVAITIFLSYYSFQYFEKYFIRLGKKVNGMFKGKAAL